MIVVSPARPPSISFVFIDLEETLALLYRRNRF